MDKFPVLEPIRLYASNTGSRIAPKSDRSKALLVSPKIGRLPTDVHLRILKRLPIPDFPSYSRAARATAALTRSEEVWEARWLALGVTAHDLSTVLDQLEVSSTRSTRTAALNSPPTLTLEDGFGDFSSVVALTSPDEMGEFVGGSNVAPIVTPPQPNLLSPSSPSKPTFHSMYMRAHRLLKPLLGTLSNPPHVVLTALAKIWSPDPNPSLRQQAKTLHLLSCFLSAHVQPVAAWRLLSGSLRSAIDRFEANLLAAFEAADSKSDEAAMREAASSSWEVWNRQSGEDWELGKVWAEKREIFYEQEKWNPLANIKADGRLEFDAMDEFMGSVLDAIREHGARAVRVFPTESGVLIGFAERLANEVIGEYVTSLLTRVRQVKTQTFLMATAASFKEAWKVVDVVVEVAQQRTDLKFERTQIEDVMFKMFETNMDEYLDEELEAAREAFDAICREWNKQLAASASAQSSSQPASGPTATRFISSHNPAQVKRNVLASFTNVLLLPVTIVPRAVGAVLTTGGRGAVQGIAMLNPQRWGGANTNGYVRDIGSSEAAVIFDEDDGDEDLPRRESSSVTAVQEKPSATFKNFDLFLSLEVALQLIHADRETLKRVETFAKYPGHYGLRVRDTIEELFILFFGAVADRHIEKGFSQATLQMTSYKPAEHEETTSVAPLMQFFELVHIGDTIQSVVQVYFDREMAPHIDRTDFLNSVMREKKRFENVLDDCVAAGLNAGTQALMNQVEHIIITRTPAREYYPQDDALLELGPTKGCTQAIQCLDMHCKLLKGSTSKEVLEVFYQEIGIRLIAVLQKHIKRQIISLTGGFQLIADLNAYHAFFSSLKVSSIVTDFAYLKMLGHVYVVEDAKDLAQIVRDVTRYGGAYRPEDIYEFIQRRSDWKKIEKVVDKTMYNLSFKEDCTVC